MKKVGRTTRPFRYDLNQSPYDYVVKVRNRFKVLDLLDRMPEELWTEICNIAQEAVIKTIPKKKKCKKVKWLPEETLEIAEKRTEAKTKDKRKVIPFQISEEFQRRARRYKKAFQGEQCS